MSLTDTVTTWRKSSYSNQDGGACVEVAVDCREVVPVRDSKVGDAQVLMFSEQPWHCFLSMLNGRQIEGR